MGFYIALYKLSFSFVPHLSPLHPQAVLYSMQQISLSPLPCTFPLLPISIFLSLYHVLLSLSPVFVSSSMPPVPLGKINLLTVNLVLNRYIFFQCVYAGQRSTPDVFFSQSPPYFQKQALPLNLEFSRDWKSMTEAGYNRKVRSRRKKE